MGFVIETAVPGRARRFYEEVFAAEVVRCGSRWVVVSQEDELSMVRRMPVDDVERTVRAVIAAGGRAVIERIEVPGGVIAYCQDPDGNVFQLTEVRCGRAARRPRPWSGSRDGRARGT